MAADAGPTDEQFRRLILDAPDVVAILEADLTVRFVCRSVRAALGFSPGEVEGTNLREYMDPAEAEDVLFEFRRTPGRAVVGAARMFEVRLQHKDGSWRRFDASVVDRLGDPGFEGVAIYLRDVTERKAHEEALVYRALHDGLTGLPNRVLFVDRLTRALGAAVRQQEPVAVLFLDVDDFKGVNDSLGHLAGDRVLVALGQRVRSCLRPGDTVARLGGDEFAVLIEETAWDAPRIAARIEEALREPLDVEGRRVQVAASVGVVVSSEAPGEGPEDLLRAADAAMYRIKRGRARGRPRAARDRVRLALEDRLWVAVEHEELDLHYQAVAAPGTRRIACMEALLRWDDPEVGNLPAREIISLAERSDLMPLLGRWILREACNQALSWRAVWSAGSPLVSVNVSARQFREASLPETVGETLVETGLEPDALILEVPKGALIDDDEEEGWAQTLRRLGALGVRIAIDDFAPGAPEFPDLERLPVDYLKFERSLVGELGRGRNNAGLLASLYTGFAQARGINVVAAGVESTEQLAAVEEMDCDLAQGFHLYRPLPGLRATELLAANLGSSD